MTKEYLPVGLLAVTKSYVKNPYKEQLSGKTRQLILDKFFNDNLIDGYQIWVAPADGGAYKVYSKEEIRYVEDLERKE